MTPAAENALIGCLLGTAVGDAMGLACEGLSRRRQAKMFPVLNGYRFLFGKCMTSDDTEHTCMLAQSVIAHGASGDEQKFLSNFAWRLRFWILGRTGMSRPRMHIVSCPITVAARGVAGASNTSTS